MMSCTCAHGQRSMCALHCDSPCLADLVYIISEAVHPVFNDGFMCFANIFVDVTTSGQCLGSPNCHGFRNLLPIYFSPLP